MKPGCDFYVFMLWLDIVREAVLYGVNREMHPFQFWCGQSEYCYFRIMPAIIIVEYSQFVAGVWRCFGLFFKVVQSWYGYQNSPETIKSKAWIFKPGKVVRECNIFLRCYSDINIVWHHFVIDSTFLNVSECCTTSCIQRFLSLVVIIRVAHICNHTHLARNGDIWLWDNIEKLFYMKRLGILALPHGSP